MLHYLFFSFYSFYAYVALTCCGSLFGAFGVFCPLGFLLDLPLWRGFLLLGSQSLRLQWLSWEIVSLYIITQKLLYIYKSPLSFWLTIVMRCSTKISCHVRCVRCDAHSLRGRLAHRNWQWLYVIHINTSRDNISGYIDNLLTLKLFITSLRSVWSGLSASVPPCSRVSEIVDKTSLTLSLEPKR